MNLGGRQLWTRTDLVAFGAFGLLGTLLVFAGWYGASGEVLLRNDEPWLSVGVIGVLVATVGNARWFLAGRRSVSRFRRQLDLDAVTQSLRSDAVAGEPALLSSLVVVRGMRRYHRPDCQLVAGKNVESMSRIEHEAADRLPCGVCRS